MRDSLVEHERRMLVLAYLKAQAEGDPAGAQEIREHADEDPELGRMLDLEDDEAARRAAQDSRIARFVAGFLSRTFSIIGNSP
ncbi:MAG: hypothetical protein ACFB50_15600 [Rubrobacteraceae bacterium]